MKSIVFKTIGVKGTLRTCLEKINGIQTAFIYGSVARNDENVSSDIDIFIIGKIIEDRLISVLGEKERELKRDINYSLYSEADFQSKKAAKDPFVIDVTAQPKIFLIGDKNDL